MLADCYRALGRHAKVDELWEELRAASPSAALVAEGRIVYAGSLADQGKLADAIAVLEAAKPPGKKPAGAPPAGRPTPWPTSTSGPATCPRPASCSRIVAGADPDSATSSAACRALR